MRIFTYGSDAQTQRGFIHEPVYHNDQQESDIGHDVMP